MPWVHPSSTRSYSQGRTPGNRPLPFKAPPTTQATPSKAHLTLSPALLSPNLALYTLPSKARPRLQAPPRGPAQLPKPHPSEVQPRLQALTL